MPLEPSQYRWRPDQTYREWSVSEDCLFPLADALQRRAETWHRPPPDEEDDSRPDFSEIRERRFYEAFDRPIEEDLRRFDFHRALMWLRVHAPWAVGKTKKRLRALRACLDPDKFERKKDAMVVELANTAWFLRQLGAELLPRPVDAAAVKVDEAEGQEDSLLAEVKATLTPSQRAIVQKLWSGPATFDSLLATPGCFSESVADESVTRQLERLQEKLNTFCELGVTLRVSAASKMATLIRPTTDKPDK